MLRVPQGPCSQHPLNDGLVRAPVPQAEDGEAEQEAVPDRPGVETLFPGDMDHAELIGLGGLEEIGVGVDPHPGQPADGDGGDDDGAGQQNDGLEGLRDHDRPQAADGRVDHRDDRDRGDGRQRRDAEELLEHGGARRTG